MQAGTPINPQHYSFEERVRFITELARHLHFAGATAQRLEMALINAADRFGVRCEPFVQPTGMILAFTHPGRRFGEGEHTRFVRLPFVETDLGLLTAVDEIAEGVMDGSLTLEEGHARMEALDAKPATAGRALAKIAALTVLAGGIALLLRLPWFDVSIATVNGLIAGLIGWYAGRRPRLHEAVAALTAVICSLVVLAAATWIAPLNQNTVIIASLIALMPGMHLTNSISELCAGHLASGVQRFAGAISIMLQLSVGAMIAIYIFELFGWQPQVQAARVQPLANELLGMLLTAGAFSVLFNTRGRDALIVIIACSIGYLIVRFGGAALGAHAGVFLSAFCMTGIGNLYGRLARRPGSLWRVPGIVMLVPGSASVKALLNVLQQNVDAGSENGLLQITYVLMAIVAGMIFGNLAVPTRSTL
ncbi:threonine/serine exporter family protein [Aquilutibacter rugosus]|uniref:threonine/serine ThrE exporter family protein n=1 Tax=Aquilutibacter rugosus TaxID=3115820 RepID=UPI002F4028CB